MTRRITLATVALFGMSSLATAGPRYAPDVFVYEAPIESRGCYYYRGRQTCGRYCYTEVDGKRYCRERQREAYPQAPVVQDFYGPETGMK